MKVIIYTDGSARSNPGRGGYGAVLKYTNPAGKTFTSELSRGYAETTNNRMELSAVLHAITENAGPLVVVMDSTYVKDGLEKWHKGWVKNGWRTKGGSPVKNREIWEPLIAARDARRDEIAFEWVKGHSGDPMNDLVDRLAVVASAGPFDEPPPAAATHPPATLFD